MSPTWKPDALSGRRIYDACLGATDIERLLYVYCLMYPTRPLEAGVEAITEYSFKTRGVSVGKIIEQIWQNRLLLQI